MAAADDEQHQRDGAPERQARSADDDTQLLRRALSDETGRRLEESVRPQAALEIYDVDGNLMEIVPVPPEGLSIGRGSDQDVRLDDRTVSRRHARIEAVGGRFILDDAGSLNDTLLNGERVRGRAELHDGAELVIGLHVLVLTIR